MPVPKSHATVCTHPMVLVGLDFMVHVHVCMCVCVCVCVCVRCTVCQLTTSDSWELSLCLHTVVNSWHSASSIRQIIVPNHNWVINHSALFSTYGSQPPTDNPEYRIYTHTHTHTQACMYMLVHTHTHKALSTPISLMKQVLRLPSATYWDFPCFHCQWAALPCAGETSGLWTQLSCPRWERISVPTDWSVENGRKSSSH